MKDFEKKTLEEAQKAAEKWDEPDWWEKMEKIERNLQCWHPDCFCIADCDNYKLYHLKK